MSILKKLNNKSFEEICPIQNRRELAASLIVKLPLLRDFSLAIGCVDASRKVASQLLQNGKILGIFVGGEQEQLLSRYGDHTAFIKTRKGFIKLALRFQIPVVSLYIYIYLLDPLCSHTVLSKY